MSGRVVDETAEPVAGVCVRVGTALGTSVLGKEARTDADGRFIVAGIPNDFPPFLPYDRTEIRWQAVRTRLGQFEDQALMLIVISPHLLLRKDDVDLPGKGFHGSTNACLVGPDETDTTLVVQSAQTITTKLKMGNLSGETVRTLSFVTVASPENVPFETTAGMSGCIYPIYCAHRFAGSLMTVIAEGYRWQHLYIDDPDVVDAEYREEG